MSYFIFWLSVIFLFYVYFGYPLAMSVLLKFIKIKPVNKANITPFVSMVISAYNEEKNIGAKLNEIFNLDYPRDKIEVMVVSDASMDKTDEIVRGFSDRGIRLFRLRQHSGKIAAYRAVFPLLKGEIIVFSDATSLLNPNTIMKLISNFNDKTVGCAGGLLMYVNPKNAIIGKGETKYWSYEKKIRNLESSLCSLTSVSGTLYAVRKELYPMDIKDDLADDLLVPFNAIKRGYRVVLEKEAVCIDYTTFNIKQEIAKRSRITIQNLRGIINQIDILNPFKYGLFSFLVISHKIGRLSVPAFLSLIFISSWLLSFQSVFFTLIFISQIMFYIGGRIGYVVNKRIRFSLGNSVFYFCLSNWAIFVGIIEFLKGRRTAAWETARA